MAEIRKITDAFYKLSEETAKYPFLEDVFVVSAKWFQRTEKLWVHVQSKEILRKEEREVISTVLKRHYNVREAEVTVTYEKMALLEDNLSDCRKLLMEQMAERYPLCWCLLNDSEWHLSEDVITICPKYGADILEEERCTSHVRELLEENFGRTVEVRWQSAKGTSGEDAEAFLKRKEKELSQAGPAYVPKEEKPKKATGKVSDSGMILGKPIKEHPIPMSEVEQDMGVVTVEGEVFKLETKEIKGGRVVVTFCLTDKKDAVTVKRFLTGDKVGEVLPKLKEAKALRVRGDVCYDKYARDVVISAYDICPVTLPERKDMAEVKRVELHLHTQMSSMDGVSSAKSLISRAAKWGHKAMAITDHGVLQAYPEAMNTAEKLEGFKVIYGVECYLVDDYQKIVTGLRGDLPFDTDFVVFDVETTGLKPSTERIIEIGAVKIEGGKVTEHFQRFVNPGKPIPHEITELTSIRDEDVADAPYMATVLEEFLDFAGDAVLVAHNAPFDMSFLTAEAERLDKTVNFAYLDTLQLSMELLPDLKRHKLNVLCDHFGIKQISHHRADDDARVTALVLLKLFELAEEADIHGLLALNSAFQKKGSIKKAKTFHTILLVKNMKGLNNLYHIISESHLNYYARRPRVPKSLLDKYREGIIVGSACEAGELYRAIVEGKSRHVIEATAGYYDYLEIQPLGNNRFMIAEGTVAGEEELKDINREICALGERLQKPVVATCDVHFLDPEDEVYRRILMAGNGFKDADQQAPLYLRTTDEMLEEFAYLGKDKAYEVVVTNTVAIADEIEEIRPIPKGTYPPKMDGAEDEIRELSYGRAKEIYGEELPEIVKARMDKELNSIITHGFSVLYMIAQKLVKHSNEDGYLVGSRGSVGSSFIAFLIGITEVNSLPAHYICPNCKHAEFITDGSYSTGADMPNKDCPHCGTRYKKDGHDIPFETFLGFKGDKAPDIDLNFSGDYQPCAHQYTEVLFGKGKVFRAGTIGTVAEKTAFGYVKKYAEERGIVYSNAQIDRLVQGCTGVKRTTGQHPGGIIVVPADNDIHNFTPVQHPADDPDSDIITTHFDYHAIHDNLLKLDILGHDDPTMIRMLEDITGLDATTIPIDDPETMSLFTSTEALGVTPEELGSPVGTFAVPEFGTKFVRQMLVDTAPTTFAELVRISGLSHGTDVWLGNAQELIKNGTATLKEAICTRDDIMLYLIQKGVEASHSFKIMESVRKGKGLTEEDEAAMRAQNVPEWYIDSCKKIKYMFPKAHAVAYVTMAFRIAYFKVHYPEAFYAAYFSVRADDFDAALMAHGQEKVRKRIRELEQSESKLLVKEKNVLTILEVCNEMYCRGIKFLPIDLYRSEAKRFMIEKDGIRPPFTAVQGLGENAALSIVEARKEKTFLSKEDLRVRTKLSQTLIDEMARLGYLGDLPDSAQVDLFALVKE